MQSEAILGLGAIRQQPERVVPILIGILDKTQNLQHSVILRPYALIALREFEAEAKPAVPSLLRLLNDERETTRLRSNAANALRAIDPEAAAKAGVK